MGAYPVLQALWAQGGLPPQALDWVGLPGRGVVLPSSFRVDDAAQASIAASALAAAWLWARRGGQAQRVSVARAHAAAEFRSERLLRVDGQPAAELWDRIAGAYRSGDGRWLRLHTNFPHHRDGVLALLGCAHDRDSVAAALLRWRADEFEQAAADRGLVVAMLRSFAEWDAHPQAQALVGLPPLQLEKLGDAAPRRLPPAARPLDGVCVLDLTRIIAGPVGARTLAAHGADVLNVSGPRLPSVLPLVMDTGRGKRSAQLELDTADGVERLWRLVDGADVFIDGYRPGALAARGFHAAALAARRPGLVVVELSAYGAQGPWAGRRGFDSLVQAASGFNHAEAQAAGSDAPQALPAQALDHATGYLTALGVCAALARQMDEGGSWRVRVSLAQTGAWLRALGRVDGGLRAPDPGWEQAAPFIAEYDSGFGRLSGVRHAAQLELTPARWERPAVPLGQDAATWMA